jgi:hypothetical protein
VLDHGEVTVFTNDDLSPFAHLRKEFATAENRRPGGRVDILK